MKNINLRAVWVIAYMNFKQMAIDGLIVFTVLIQPLLVAIIAILLLRDTNDFQATYIIVGSSLSGLWGITIYHSSMGIITERWTGTLEEVVGSPTGLPTVVLGKLVSSGLLSFVSMMLSYPLVAFLFELSIPIRNPLLFFLSIPIALASVLSLGFLISPLIALNPGTMWWLNAIEFPVYIFGGFLFSVVLLPDWCQPFCYLLSPYWAARILHLTSSGSASVEEVLLCWIMLVLLLIINWIIALKLFKFVLYRTRVTATLSQQ